MKYTLKKRKPGLFFWSVNLLPLLLWGQTGADPARPANRPNIIIIMADDLGFSDLGCYGGEVETPQLAKNGLRYKQFYNAARCCPSRAALMTGLYPHQAGMGWMAAADLGTPAYAGNLNNTSVTIAEVLKTAGYSTYMTGKWHLTNERKISGKVIDSWPVQRGFDRYFGIIPGGANYFTPTVYSNNTSYEAPENFYLTHAISDTSVAYIRDHFRGGKGNPFFMYVAYTAPHWPLHALQPEIDKYVTRYKQGWDRLRRERFERQRSMGLITNDRALSARDSAVIAWDRLSPAEQDEMTMRMAIYAAQTDLMDQGIGRIVDELRRQGALDNTLIFFLSDNGACAEYISSGKSKEVDGTNPDTFESYRIQWANLSSTPFREYKHYVHEGGIATPLIVHWPKGVRNGLKNSFVEGYGHITDLMATCTEVAGATYPRTFKGYPIQPMEGKSLLPHFTGGDNQRGKVFWEHEANIALRDGKWKLVAKTKQDAAFNRQSLELYDMEADPSELNNLAARFPERVETMYNEWNSE
jgi:arylsulfatase A-like enzyme